MSVWFAAVKVWNSLDKSIKVNPSCLNDSNTKLNLTSDSHIADIHEFSSGNTRDLFISKLLYS